MQSRQVQDLHVYLKLRRYLTLWDLAYLMRILVQTFSRRRN